MKYVVAVSGGVDSMVLLDALVHNRLSELTNNVQQMTSSNAFIVVHFDHGIRGNSAEDEALVQKVAMQHGLQYETKRVELGAEASEDQARKARYEYLRKCCKKYNAQLVTAHHQDDVLETMVINLIRGTGWRGLAPMARVPQDLDTQFQIFNKNQIWRPLIGVLKQDILAYAKKYNVQWREDSTNTNTAYLRNYVRHILFPAMEKNNSSIREKLIDINKKQTVLKNEIATELQNIITNYHLSNINAIVPRYDLIMSPPLAAKEIIHHIITQLDPDWHPSSVQITRTLHFIKTAKNGKSMDITKQVRATCTLRTAEFFVKDI